MFTGSPESDTGGTGRFKSGQRDMNAAKHGKLSVQSH